MGKGKIGSFKYIYIFDYYPKNRYKNEDISEMQINMRKIIWNFKDGENTDVCADLVSDMLNKLDEEKRPKYWFCIIPASTKRKTEIRFMEFCNLVSQSTGINNGYSLITVQKDHEESKGKQHVNKISNLNFSEEIKGKGIILFDDVSTTGESFAQASQKILDTGGFLLFGFFLGKTVYKYNSNT